jgi:hypothetical protein
MEIANKRVDYASCLNFLFHFVYLHHRSRLNVQVLCFFFIVVVAVEQ